MIPQTNESEKVYEELSCQFIRAIKELKISHVLSQCNIRKDSRNTGGQENSEKRTAFEILQFLIMLVFEGRGLFCFLGSKKQDIACSKNTYYRFMEDPHYNWRRFITLLAARVTAYFNSLTKPERVRAFVLDDSVIPRNRSKKVELLSWIFDHVIGKTVRGFNMLTLGWTDCYSFVPVAFNMMASAKESKRIVQANKGIDKRTIGHRNRVDAVMQKPDAAIDLIRSALSAGIQASYVLMDTWFTNEPFIKRVCDEGLDVIGMLKGNRQMYHYHGGLMNLQSLAGYVRYNRCGDIIGSIVVKTRRHSIPVKLVFVRNRNKRNEAIIILSTDISLTPEEIARICGARWSIECFHKVDKSLLKLGKEYQGLSYDMTVSSTAIVFTRYIILEWLRRKENDQKTIGEIFFVCCDDIQDLELSTALASILSLFVEGIRKGTVIITEAFRLQLVNWYVSQPRFIKALFPETLWEV